MRDSWADRILADLRTLVEPEPSLGARAVPAPDCSLLDFLREAWPWLEPDTRLVEGWYLEALCLHFEAVARGEVRDLLVTIPPRSLKSTVGSVCFPAWVWTFDPAARFLTASYAAPLAVEHARQARTLMQTSWYRERWGHVFRFAGDQNLKTSYENDRRGRRIAVGSKGATGRGGDILICDDPHDVAEGESDQERGATVDWFRRVFSTRRNDPKTGRRVVIQQRIHEADVAGVLLAEGGWEHLNLPQRFDPADRCRTGIGWEDPRTAPDEPLCPERMGPVEIAREQKILGPAAFAAQHDQQPVAAGGGVFKVADWRWYRLDRPPGHPDGPRARYGEVACFVDTALKDKQVNDWAVFAVWGRLGDEADLLWVVREHADLPRLEAIAAEVWRAWRPRGLSRFVVEDKVAGTTLLQANAAKRTGKLPMVAYDPGSRDKVERAQSVTGWQAAGGFRLPCLGAPPASTKDAEVEAAIPPWLWDWWLEHRRFPKAAHDDCVDTTSAMGRYWFIAPPPRGLGGAAATVTGTAKTGWFGATTGNGRVRHSPRNRR